MNNAQHPLPPMLIDGQPLAAAQPLSEWQQVTLTCPPQRQSATVNLRIGGEDLGSPTLRLGDPTWRWTWNPENRTGTFPVVLTLGAISQDWTLTVVPSKLRCEHYQQLLADLQTVALALMLSLGGGAVGAESGPLLTPRSFLLAWPQLEHQVTQALALVQTISRSPQTVQQRTTTTRPINELDTIDGAALAALATGPLDDIHDDALPALQRLLRPAARTQGGPLPQSIAIVRTSASHDCFEHRLLRGVIDRLARQVAEFGVIIQRERERRTRSGTPGAQFEEVRCGQQRAARELRRVLQQPLLAGLPAATHCVAPTHLMRHDRRYRALYQLWHALRETPQLALDSPIFNVPLADLPTLYEQWCLLQTAALLTQLGAVEHQSLFKPGSQGAMTWSLALAENCPLLSLRLPNGAQATLYYQRRYAAGRQTHWGSLDPFLRIPDIAIELEQPGVAPRCLLLDAKYRVMPDGSLPQSALDTAYTYRGSVGYNGQAATGGVWLLFPGTQPVLVGDVGALPMRPDDTDALQKLLIRAIRDDTSRI